MENKTKIKVKLGYIEGLVSILVNILLFFLKYWAGVVSGSIALIADAWHTLSDSLSSVILIAGIKLSSRKPDKQHAFGHGRWEQITAIFIGFLLGIIGFEFLKESVARFYSHEAANFGKIAVIVTIISIALKEALAQFAFYIARRTDNVSVRADGWHHRTDALSSVLVLAGILLRDLFWWIDSVLGFIIAILIFYAAFEIIRDAINRLLGETPTEELIGDIKIIIQNSSSVKLHPHHFHIHNYGSHRELTFHIKLDGETDINTGHNIANNIEDRIREKLNIESTIHLEPLETDH